MSNFKASLLVDNCSSLEVSCDCKKISFKDTSNYSTNTTPGHESTDFTSRVITITRGDNSTFQLITADVRTNNPTLYPLSKENITYKIIPPHNISNNTFSYTFLSTDEDGIWKVELCTYPNWRDDITYQAILKPIVLFQGKLYQAIVDSVNVNPANDTNHVYWADYVDTSDCSDTRYCTTQRIAITCISIENCYREAVASAFCAIENNPCKNMCDNKDFMKAMKMRVVMDGLEFASCGLDWATAQKHMEVLKSLCCCN